MRIRFGFRWVPFLATVLVVALGIALGNWQMRRADEKRAIETKLTERQALPPYVLTGKLENGAELEYRKLALRGEFVRDWPLYLENRPQAGQAGFYLLMPFKIAGSDYHVLVERGWFPLDPRKRTNLPVPITPGGPLELEGVAVAGIGKLMQLGQAPAVKPGAILQNLTVGEVAKAAHITMQSFVLEQTSAAPDKLVRDWPKPSAGIERHLGYAFQWYALALTAFIFFVVTGYRRGNRRG